MSISFKIVFFSTVLAAIFLGASFLYVLIEVRSIFVETSQGRLEAEVIGEKNKIELVVNNIKSTILSIQGTPPFQGMIRAQKTEGFDETGASSYAQWQTRLQAIFKAEIEATGLYDQLRYIDENGQEIVRVDNTLGKAVVVTDDKLQNKQNRTYFLETQTLTEGEIYVSKTELNREGVDAELSIPYRPIIRYATPIFDIETGARKGIVIANVLVDQLIAQTSLQSNFSSDIYIIDAEGYFILHPQEDKEWGSPRDLNTGVTLLSEFSGIEELSLERDKYTFENDTSFFSYTSVLPDKQDTTRRWIILEVTPRNIIFGPINNILVNAFIFALLAFIGLFFLFMYGVRYVLSPLRDLMQGVEGIAQGNFTTEVNVRTNDEIGSVARAFNTMVKKLKTAYGSLEDQVEVKTRELKNKVGELENTQKAMTNILEDIEEEKEKIETILESIGDGVFVIDANMRIVLYNTVAARLSGFSQQEAVGAPYGSVLRFVHQDNESTSDDFITQVFATGTIQEMGNHTELIRKDGTRVAVADSAAPLVDQQGKVTGVVVVFRDVSRERAIDQAKSEFVSLASHQLRTPLSAIGWNTELLLTDQSDGLSADQKETLNEIQKANKRMIELVNALLNTSRIDMGTFSIETEPTDFVAIADSVCEELEPSMVLKQLTLTKQYDADIPLIDADPKLVRIILQNFLSNAVKYTPKEGQITCMILTEQANLHIAVADTGYGIPIDQHDKIFTKLFRADNVRDKDVEGTGLGLYIVRSIVEEGGGKIWFESEENQGSTFHVTIPLSGMKNKEGTKGLQ